MGYPSGEEITLVRRGVRYVYCAGTRDHILTLMDCDYLVVVGDGDVGAGGVGFIAVFLDDLDGDKTSEGAEYIYAADDRD